MQISLKHSLRTVLLAAFAAVALLLAACGDDGDSAGGGPDPATVAPADAPLYGSAAAKPEGEVKEGIEGALGRLTGSDDPGGMIRDAIAAEIDSDDSPVSFEEDIEPWLGERMGFFLTEVSGDDGEGALAVASTDTGASEETIAKLAEDEDSVREESYEGVDYRIDDEDFAVGIVEDFVVAGTEQGFQDAVDAANGESLADNSDATEALDEAPDDNFFEIYADVGGLIEIAEQSGALSARDKRSIEQQYGSLGEGPAVAWGEASEEAIAFEVSASSSGEAESTDLVSTLPADAWFAFGAAAIGKQLDNAIAGLETSLDQLPSELRGSGVKSLPDVNREFEDATGLDLESDLGWIGNAGGYVSGTSVFGLGGGLVIEATDDGEAEDAIDSLRQALSSIRDLNVSPSGGGPGFEVQIAGAPIGFEVAVEDGKVVLAAGGATVDDILNPPETLADSDRFETASGQLEDGMEPMFFFDFVPMIELVEGTGQTQGEPDWQSAKPYLERLDYMIAGGSYGDDRASSRFVLGLREGSGGGEAAVIIP
jgi:hypothetical protein